MDARRFDDFADIALEIMEDSGVGDGATDDGALSACATPPDARALGDGDAFFFAPCPQDANPIAALIDAKAAAESAGYYPHMAELWPPGCGDVVGFPLRQRRLTPPAVPSGARFPTLDPRQWRKLGGGGHDDAQVAMSAEAAHAISAVAKGPTMARFVAAVGAVLRIARALGWVGAPLLERALDAQQDAPCADARPLQHGMLFQYMFGQPVTRDAALLLLQALCAEAFDRFEQAPPPAFVAVCLTVEVRGVAWSSARLCE